MKNIFIILFIGFGIVSCGEPSKPTPQKQDGDTYGTKLITLSANGKSHEFIYLREGGFDNAVMGISHWPECKYCKCN